MGSRGNASLARVPELENLCKMYTMFLRTFDDKSRSLHGIVRHVHDRSAVKMCNIALVYCGSFPTLLPRGYITNPHRCILQQMTQHVSYRYHMQRPATFEMSA